MSDAQKMKKSMYNLSIFTVSKLISAVGANILAFGISLYILKMTGSATSFAINMICTILPRIIFSPVVGYLADNYSKKLIIITSQIMIVVTMVSLLIYTEIVGMSVVAIYIMTIFYSIFGAFSGISLTASIGNLIHPERIQKAMSLNQMAVSIAAIAAPIIGGILFGMVTIEVFLVIQIVAYTISTFLDSTMNFKLFTVLEEGEQVIKEKMLESMKRAIGYVASIPVLKTIMILSLWLNLFFSAISVGSSFILVEVLHLKSIDVGWVQAFGAFGMLLASIYLTIRKKINNPIVFSKYALLAMGGSLLLMIVPIVAGDFSYKILVFYCMAAFFIMTICEICTNIPIGILLQQTIEEKFRGRVFALLDTMAMAMMPIGSLIYGLLYDLVDAQYVLLVTACIIIGLTLYMLRPSKVKSLQNEGQTISKIENKGINA